MADPDSSISGFRFAPDVRRLVSIKTSRALSRRLNSTYRLDGSSRCLPSFADPSSFHRCEENQQMKQDDGITRWAGAPSPPLFTCARADKIFRG